jgi:glycerol-1-phosphatase
VSDGQISQDHALTDVDWAFDRYESVRARLPSAVFPATSMHTHDLSAVAGRYDAFILDAFGVLNVGTTPIPGAVARMAQLRAMGKRLIVLTNAASYTRAEAMAKYRALGFDFTADEVVSSRDAAVARLPSGLRWAAVAAAGDTFADIPAQVDDLIDDPDALSRAGGILFLSSVRWWPDRQARLTAALRDHPRLVIIANPDIVAPREDGLTVEPGAYGHDLTDATGIACRYFGKPFPDAYDDALARLPGIPRDRIAMVGDTLHTDVLGGRAAGIGSVLITGHGLFAGRDTAPYIARSGIVPDVIAVTT